MELKYNKKYGQNFIFDKNLLTAIVNDSQIDENDEVLEIGAGAGTLTLALAKKAKKVVSYEIDENLKEVLSDNLQGVGNVKIVFLDALKTDIKEIEKDFGGDYCLVANLPYYITTPLIFKFIEQTDRIKSITIMVQKEVADRLVASKNSKDYGKITVMLNFYGKVKVLRNVSKNMFTPRPNVDSCIVKIDMEKNKFDCDPKVFAKVVHSAFSMRRKTLLNNLCVGMEISKAQAMNLIQKAGIDPSLRAENLEASDFVKLCKAYST